MYFDFSPCETEFVHETSLLADFCSWNLLRVYVSVRKTYTLIFLLVKPILFVELLAHWFFALWNLYIDFFLLTDFFHGTSLRSNFFVSETCCVLYCFHETGCPLFFLFVKLLRWFFSSLNSFYLWHLLRGDFFLLIKHFACWFFSPVNLYIVFFPHKTNFIHGTCCVLIFVHSTCCVIFVMETHCVLVFQFVKLIYWFFLLVKLILFLEFVACWVLCVELVVCQLLFVKLVA